MISSKINAGAVPDVCLGTIDARMMKTFHTLLLILLKRLISKSKHSSD